MNWFYNMKTMKKLVLGFATVCAIMVFVGYMGLTRMGEISQMTNDLYEIELQGVSNAKEVNINLLQIGRAVSNAILADDPAEITEQQVQIETFAANLQTALADAKPSFYLPEGIARVAEVEKLFPEYLKTVNTVTELARLNKDEEAAEALVQLREIANQIESVLDSMVSIKVGAGAAANK
jgi:CHASE3 domain sensor protein